MKEDLRGFCCAPWTDCIAYADGALRPCDRNNTSFGNWQQDGLQNVWNGPAARQFRSDIAAGVFPDEDCESCYRTGTARWPERSLASAHRVHLQQLRALTGENLTEISDLAPYFYKRTADRGFSLVQKNYQTALNRHRTSVCANVRLAVLKLQVVLDSLAAFLQGKADSMPVAPFRQVQLTAKCNSRCIMCVGKFTGEIMNGPTMPDEHVLNALAEPGDVLDFFSNGSEFLLHRNWREFALKLAKDCGTKLRFSTNGILLKPKASEFLIDNEIIETLTCSLDGATKPTMEAIRVNVKYDENMANLRHLFRHAARKNYRFNLVFGYVFMRRNYHEFAEFIRLVDRLRGDCTTVTVTVLIQTLENMDVPEYRHFVHGEHHDLIPRFARKSVLQKAWQESQRLNVPVTFYGHSLREFIIGGADLPEFFVRSTDRDLLWQNRRRLRLRLLAWLKTQATSNITAEFSTRPYLNAIEREIVASDAQFSRQFAEFEADCCAEYVQAGSVQTGQKGNEHAVTRREGVLSARETSV